MTDNPIFLPIGSKAYTKKMLDYANERIFKHRMINSTSFYHFWNYPRVEDAKKAATGLRRYGYSATIIAEPAHRGNDSGIVHKVYYRDWGMGKKPKPDWRKKTNGAIAPASRARRKT